MRVDHVGTSAVLEEREKRLFKRRQFRLQGIFHEVGGIRRSEAAYGCLLVDGLDRTCVGHAQRRIIECPRDDIDARYIRARRLCRGRAENVGDMPARILCEPIADRRGLETPPQGHVHDIHRFPRIQVARETLPLPLRFHGGRGLFLVDLAKENPTAQRYGQQLTPPNQLPTLRLAREKLRGASDRRDRYACVHQPISCSKTVRRSAAWRRFRSFKSIDSAFSMAAANDA